MWFGKYRNFGDIHPFFYAISFRKELLKRHLRNLFSKEKIAKTIQQQKLPHVVFTYSSNLIKRGKGIDPVLQYNKADNIRLACAKMNGMVIRPGEVFSFWRTIGKTSVENGFKEGRVIVNGKLTSGTGGGLCNLANTLNLLVLNSPLEIVEFHKHSDALSPDAGKRVPLSSGTSVSYNYIDYRFRNNTGQDVQLFLWVEDEKLFGELRSERAFPYRYEIVEEDHHFRKEGGRFYRVSKIYRTTIEKATGNILDKTLIWDNHSMVMFDDDLIPKDQIRG